MNGPMTNELPHTLYSGCWKAGHVQGIAVDIKSRCIYYSFTTMIVKTDLCGNLIGWADGIVGHLGCLALCDDGRIYASLEYKNDSIGRDIRSFLGRRRKPHIGFYVAVIDGKKIDRPGMNAERDGIMTTVWLEEPLADHRAKVKLGRKRVEHRFGCSGVDGLTFGPEYGKRDGKKYLNISYGIYSDHKRDDNDHQVILQYDISDWSEYERPLSQTAVHRKGPKKPRGKYFVFTGNTDWGVQNFEYDSFSGNWLMAVYKGSKPQYPNYDLFVIDGAVPPKKGTVKCGNDMIPAELLTLCEDGMCHQPSGIYGYNASLGSTGLFSLGNGYFYISEKGKNENGRFSTVRLYRWTGNTPCPFERVE